jgi:hypothetical protein
VAPVNTGGHPIADGALPFGAMDAALVDGACQLAASITNHGAVVNTTAGEQLLPGGWHSRCTTVSSEDHSIQGVDNQWMGWHCPDPMPQRLDNNPGCHY